VYHDIGLAVDALLSYARFVSLVNIEDDYRSAAAAARFVVLVLPVTGWALVVCRPIEQSGEEETEWVIAGHAWG
jgi:hypothetical protein